MDFSTPFPLSVVLAASILSLFVGGLISFALSKARNNKDRLEVETERATLRAELEASLRSLDEQRVQLTTCRNEINALSERLVLLSSEKASAETQLKNEQASAQDKLLFLNDAQRNLSDAFAALSRQALAQNSSSFVEHAKEVLSKYHAEAQSDLLRRQERISEMVVPVQRTLERVDLHIAEMEKQHAGTFAAVDEQMKSVVAGQRQLSETTASLVSVLKNSKARGQWGELQLRRAVELAGMTSYCDFVEQESLTTSTGRQRPDMVVRLPAERTIVVDAKVPMDSYFSAFDAADGEARKFLFLRHAKALRDHITMLSKKTYFVNAKHSPEFVLMFLPNEAVYSVALEHDPSLIEFGAMNNVIVATPVTLIALLKAAEYGWRQENLAAEVKQISILGRQVFERLKKMTQHISKVGDSLDKSVKNYNAMIGALEGRVLPSVRRLNALKSTANGGELSELLPLETATRQIQAGELRGTDGDAAVFADDQDVDA